MWGIDSSIVLVLIPIVFVGIIAVSVIGSRDEQTRGDRISKFFSIASNAAIFFTVLALLYQVIDSEEESNDQAYSQWLETYYRIDQMQWDHPEIFEVVYPGNEFNRMGNDEKLAIQYTHSILGLFERLYLMHRSGAIEDQVWNSWENWLRFAFTSSDFFKSAWEASCGVYRRDFVDYIEENYSDGTCRHEDSQVGDQGNRI